MKKLTQTEKAIVKIVATKIQENEEAYWACKILASPAERRRKQKMYAAKANDMKDLMRQTIVAFGRSHKLNKKG